MVRTSTVSRRVSFLAVALALSSCAALSGSGSGGGSSGQNVGEPLPDIVVRSFYGRRDIPLRGHKGKVLLIDIWASWCAPCKEELPLLDRLAGRLAGKGVEIIAISIDEEKAAAEDFLRGRKWKLTLAHDPTGQVPSALAPPKMPTSYIVDGQGIVRHVNAGFEPGDIERMETRLLELAQTR
jgi:thiol-disulfide isomerase/thioredoxin